jgi:hypothetical protein
MSESTILLLQFWPIGVGAVVGALVPRGLGWLLGFGVAASVLGVLLTQTLDASAGHEFISDRDFWTMAVIWWGVLWLLGVLAGAGLRIYR